MYKRKLLMVIIILLTIASFSVSAKIGCVNPFNTNEFGSSTVISTRNISGQAFQQDSENIIAPLGGAKVTVKSVQNNATKETSTESDGSFSMTDVPADTTVEVIIEKDGYITQTQIVNTSSANPKALAFLNIKNPIKKTIQSNQDTDLDTTTDITDKGEPVPPCHIIVPTGAITNSTEVELTPYFTLYTLPAPIPTGYIGLAGADFSASLPVTFTSGKEAKPYIVLPSSVRAEELSQANIKLMVFINLPDGQAGGNWVIVKNDSGQDKRCKYYSSGLYQGMLGPDDSAAESNQASIKGIRPFCFVMTIPQVATINGSVKNKYGIAIQGAMVFGGGPSTTTDSSGNYSLQRVIALSSTSDSLIMVNAIAPGYQMASAAAAVRAGSTVNNVNITLETLSEVAIIGGNVKDGSTNNPIAGAKVVCQTENQWITGFTYDNKNTPLDLSDDVLSVTPPANISYYKWFVTSPRNQKYQSLYQFNNFAVLNDLFSESGFGDMGSYRVDLELKLSDGKTVEVMAGFLMKLVNLQARITDIRLLLSFDPSMALESFTNNLGNYRMIGVPSGVVLKLQASKNGYQSSGIRTIAFLTPGGTKEENFIIY